MEEARWWCMVKAEKRILNKTKMSLSAEGRVTGDQANIQALTSGVGMGGNFLTATGMVGNDFVDKALQAATASIGGGGGSGSRSKGAGGKPKPKPKSADALYGFPVNLKVKEMFRKSVYRTSFSLKKSKQTSA